MLYKLFSSSAVGRIMSFLSFGMTLQYRDHGASVAIMRYDPNPMVVKLFNAGFTYLGKRLIYKSFSIDAPDSWGGNTRPKSSACGDQGFALKNNDLATTEKPTGS